MVNWPIGEGVTKGSEEIAVYVKHHSGAIAYVEYDFSLQLNRVSLKNNAGNFVLPNKDTFSAAIKDIDWKKFYSVEQSLTDRPGENSWPIVGATFVLLPIEKNDIKHSSAVFNFIDWGYRSGADMALELDYIPIPAHFAGFAEEIWKKAINKREI